MIAPRYVGASTTTVSPLSRNVLQSSSSASIPPLVISSSSSAGRRPCTCSSRPATASSVPGMPARRRVLEGDRLAGLRELGEQLRRALAREGQRVGEAARERDQVGAAEEAEHERDPLADVAARALGEQLLPVADLRGDRHRRRLDGGHRERRCRLCRCRSGHAAQTLPPRQAACPPSTTSVCPVT